MTAIFEFWEVYRLYEKEAWWCEMNSSSLPAIPVSREISFPLLLSRLVLMCLP